MRRAAAAMVVLGALATSARADVCGDDGVCVPDGWRIAPGVADRDGATAVHIEYRMRADLTSCEVAIVPGATLADDVFGWFDERHWVLHPVDGTVHVYVCAELPDGELAWSSVVLATQPSPDVETLGVVAAIVSALQVTVVARVSRAQAAAYPPRTGEIVAFDALLLLRGRSLDGPGAGVRLVRPPRVGQRLGAIEQASARVAGGDSFYAADLRAGAGVAARSETKLFGVVVGLGLDDATPWHADGFGYVAPQAMMRVGERGWLAASVAGDLRFDGGAVLTPSLEWYLPGSFFRGVSLSAPYFVGHALTGELGFTFWR